MKKKIVGLLALIVVLGIAIGGWISRPIGVTHETLANSQLAPIIPMRAFYADANARWRFRLSPDGKKLSWLESKWFKPALWVKDVDGQEKNIFHTSDVVRWYAWASDSKHLLYQADRDGWENDVLVSIDTSKPGAKPRSYDFGKDVKSFFYKIPDNSGSKVLIGHNGRDRSQFDLYELDLVSGKTNPLGQSVQQGVQWHITNKGKIFARTRHVSGKDWRFELRENNKWRELVRGSFEDIFWPAAAPDDNGQMLAVSNIGRDVSGLVKVDIKDGREQKIDQHSHTDYGGVVMDKKRQTPLMGIINPGYQLRRFFDKDFEAIIKRLDVPSKANLHIISTTRDQSKTLVEIEQAHAGYQTRLIDRKTGKITNISTPGITKLAKHISPVDPVFIRTKDGLTIPAFLSVPKGVKKPVPLVIIIHGGPVARSFGGWNTTRAWMNNRGYAVLDVNYRGSAGYGRKFREAAIGEVSRKMNQDIVDARQWAVDQGIADPKKVAVFGGSFGGLKVLTAMSRNPELYAAGIDINGISDISSMLREVPVYWRGWPDWYRKYIGDPNNQKEKAEIIDRSPLTHADKIKKPLLIIQGSNDVRVIRNQADRMVKALKKHGAPYEYVLIKGAGHQSRNWGWKQRIIMARKIERFLAKHLGGRADGFDYTVLGAHILP